MPLLTMARRDAIAQALSRPDARAVMCLCAAWCDTCEDLKATFERLSDADPSSAYIWLDIEDDSAVVGDVDVENCPTLAVFRGGRPIFYGVTLPQEPVVARTLASLADAAAPATDVPPEVARLFSTLRSAAPDGTR